jgi:hypothetical protein
MAARLQFDVFGTRMLVERDAAGWRVWKLGNEGKRWPLHIAVPECLEESEIGQYLDDLFHEAATPAHPGVRRIEE